MCILFFYINESATNNEYKLILASNRDEFYARPALIANQWQENERVIGGRDMEPGREGGTWLAISTKKNLFKFGALLNITGEVKDVHALARGNLVGDYVASDQTNADYCHQLIESDKKYNTFSLVSIEIRDNKARTINFCNVLNEIEEWPQEHIFAFGNSFTTTPLQKVRAAKTQFRDILKAKHQTKNELVDDLMKLLCNREKHWPDAELHRRAPTWNDHLSSICVRVPDIPYGSRTRTVVLIDANNNVDFFEETMATTNPEGEWTKTHNKTSF